MKHEYSLAHLTALSLAPPRMIEVAADAGYQYVSLRINRVTLDEPLYDVANDRGLMKETKARLADTGVKVCDVELARMGPDRDADSYQELLDASAELGARFVIAQLPDPDRDRATERFARLCDLAKPLGLFVGLEFTTWSETPDLSAATAVMRAVNRPNAGILVDTLHFSRSRCSQDELKKLPREWFQFTQVCDAPKEIPTTTEGLLHTARLERLFPGEGELDVLGILACLPPEIPYSLEIPRASLEAAVGVEECCRLALKAAHRNIDTA